MAFIFHTFFVTLLLLGLSLIYFKGRQLILPNYITSILVVGFVYWQPYFFQMNKTYFAYLFSKKTSSSLAYYFSPTLLLVGIFLIFIFIIVSLEKDRYTFIINTKESAKSITEKSLHSLKINFESEAESSLLAYYNNTRIKYRNDTIDLSEIQDLSLKLAIITAIKKTLTVNGNPNIKIGIFMLATAIIFFSIQFFILF